MTPDLTFFHISDLHFGREDHAALQWVKDAIALEQPDAVLITGDLTMRARHREFSAARDWIGDLGVPVTLEVGNHDMPYFNLWERFADPFARFLKLERLIERPLGFGALAVVPLCTTTRAQWRWPWVDGWVREAALAETLAAIDALPADTRVLVTAHHPLPERSAEGKRLTIGGMRAMEELARRKVAAVLTGHVHDPFDLIAQTAAGPLRMIGAGTLSTRLRSTPPSYNRIELAGGEVRVEVRNHAELPSPMVQVGAVPGGPLPGEAHALA